jgi:hypothetical protein
MFRSPTEIRPLAAAILAATALTTTALPCRGEVRLRALVIGNNRAPADGVAPLPPLRFADDDAAAFYELLQESGDQGFDDAAIRLPGSPTAGERHLLTVMDRETQQIHPRLAGVARPPTLSELRQAVASIGESIRKSRLAGDRNVLFLFFSGHGSVTESGTPVLALLDGAITQQLLYDEILDKLPADYVHIFVDACHAEAVVRPRDTQAQPVKVAPATAHDFLVRSTLARFPHVGAIVAASGDAQAHEWEALGHGVFTHELLSAMRGAADVNRDRRIEYSEVYAFMGAANRLVDDPRARLSVVARPPDIDRRVPILDLARFAKGRSTWLTGLPPQAGLVQIEDRAGRRLVSVRAESELVTDLVLPAGTTIYVRAGDDREAAFESAPGDVVPFGSLSFQGLPSRPRGPLADSLRRGLFATAFGRRYYAGFIDQAPEFVAVSFASEAAEGGVVRLAADDRAVAPDPPARWVALAGASNAVAADFAGMLGLRVGWRSGGRRGAFVSLDVFRAGQPDLAEWRTMGSLGWRWSADLGPVRGWLGAAVAGGVMTQVVRGSPRWTGALAAGPAFGATVGVWRGFGLSAEAQLLALGYRRDDRTVVSPAPSVFLGAFFDF